jgi:branched-chain amino acid transport system substrate-binding protein
VNAKGDLTGDQHAGNLFFNPSLAQALGTDIAGAYVGGFAVLPGDVKTPEIEEYLASADKTWKTLPAGSPAVSPALRRRPPGSASCTATTPQAWHWPRPWRRPVATPLRTCCSRRWRPHARAPLRRHQPGREPQRHRDVGLSQLVEENGEIVQKAVAIIPEVDQTFGGTFSTDTPAPGA